MTRSNVLSKGLTFTPTPQNNKHELRTDIKEYTRKLRVAEYFYEEDDGETELEEQNCTQQVLL